VWRWVKGQVVLDVPEESALCEFDCRKKQCILKEETCDRRLHKAQGTSKQSEANIRPFHGVSAATEEEE
jgi:hypothetical protein